MGRSVRLQVALCLAITVILAQVAPGFAAFSDTTAHWARQSIDRMSAKGVITGYLDGTFQPDKPVSRLEALVMLVRLMGLDETAQSTSTIPAAFSNPEFVPDWARGYVAVGVERGILKGSDLTAFNGGAEASRGAVAVWLVRALGLEGEAQAAAGRPLPFADAASIPEEMRGYVYVVNERGLIRGFTDNTFRPGDSINRAQMATALARADRLQVNALDARSVTGTVESVDAVQRRVVVRTPSGAGVTLTVAVNAALYSGDGRPLILSEVPAGTQIEAVRNSLGTVVYLELLQDVVETPAPQPPTTPEPGSGLPSSGRGYIYQASLDGAGTLQIVGTDARLRTFKLAGDAVIRRGGSSAARSALTVGTEVTYAAAGDTITSLTVGGSSNFYTGRVYRVEATAQQRLIIFDYEDDGRRRSRVLNVGAGVPITREGQAAALTDLKAGDRIIIRYDGDQALSLTAFQWEKTYEGTLEALVFAPDPRLRVQAAQGLVELALPDDPADVDYRRQEEDDPDDYEPIDLLDLAAGDQITVTTEGGEVEEVTVLRGSASASGTIRQITIADDIRLTLRPDGGGAEQTYRVAPDVRVESGGGVVSLLDVRAGSHAELHLVGGQVTRIVLEALQTLEEFRGRVVFLYGDVAIVEPLDEPGTYRQVELDSGGLIVRFNKITSLIGDLEVGDLVLVVGNQRGGRFHATSIVVVGAN